MNDSPLPFFAPGADPGASFVDLLRKVAPHDVPGAQSGIGPAPTEMVHATTVLAIRFADGVVMAGDRRATMGNLIASRDIQKVHPADAYSCIGIAGTAGVGLELMRLFQVELEHHEKIEGTVLSLDGKANRLSTMIRSNLPMAMQGLAVVPLFAGYDSESEAGRIFSYDVAGGPYEELRFHSIGSGSLFAKSALKKYYSDDMPVTDAILACVQSLYDAADDDTATGGPDMTRRIFPVVMTATAQGTHKLSDAETGALAEAIVAERTAAQTA